MIRSDSLYEACQDLFAAYPLAAQTASRSGTVRSMVLMLQDGDDSGFFVLSCDERVSKPSYSLWPWPAGHIVNIEAGGSVAASSMAVNAVTRGIPIPRDGSFFGWARGNVIAALIVIYVECSPAYPEPGWAVMPLAGTPEEEWPPFTGGPLSGHWSWEECRAGSVISLDSLIAGTPETVCWVDTKAILGSDCCAVARDIRIPPGHLLRRGCYVYYQALQAGMPAPSLEVLLADPGKIDLAPRFLSRRTAAVGQSTLAEPPTPASPLI